MANHGAGDLEGYTHRPAEMIFKDYAEQSHSWKTICEGGRMSKALFRQHGAKIAELLGVDVADQMHPLKTLIVTP